MTSIIALGLSRLYSSRIRPARTLLFLPGEGPPEARLAPLPGGASGGGAAGDVSAGGVPMNGAVEARALSVPPLRVGVVQPAGVRQTATMVTPRRVRTAWTSIWGRV